jgi:hypothetical protein
MGARASDLVRRDFGLDVNIARYVAAYNELLGDPVRRGTPAARPSLA